jgi:hypothetical protein
LPSRAAVVVTIFDLKYAEGVLAAGYPSAGAQPNNLGDHDVRRDEQD